MDLAFGQKQYITLMSVVIPWFLLNQVPYAQLSMRSTVGRRSRMAPAEHADLRCRWKAVTAQVRDEQCLIGIRFTKVYIAAFPFPRCRDLQAGRRGLRTRWSA